MGPKKILENDKPENVIIGYSDVIIISYIFVADLIKLVLVIYRESDRDARPDPDDPH